MDIYKTNNSSEKEGQMQHDENKLAQFLKEKRTVSGLSQKEVATKLGYSTSQFISNWERGVSQPPINTLRTLATMYKISAEQMFNVLLEETMIQVQADLKKKFYEEVDVKINQSENRV